MVYFIVNVETQRIKIGKAIDPRKRMRDLQAGNDYPLALLGHIKGNVPTESMLHRHFVEHRYRGEWFTKAITTDVMEIIDAGEWPIPAPSEGL